ncbi:MAG: biopolymer transporter ExbD [Flavobacteriales bacterium]|nr:biopolymer transporter ExbD [Flavobacteriales bacterium]
MQLRRTRREHAEVSTESLNDIMFFLLLFFLIVSTMANPNVIKLLLPEAKQSQTLDKQQVLLQVTADHQYYIDQTMIPEADLKGALLDKTAGMDKPTIVLRLDKALSVQDLVNVLEIGTEIKVKMILATKNG